MRTIVVFSVAPAFCGGVLYADEQKGAEQTKRPISAVVEPAGGKDKGVGNIVVTYADGTKDHWTTKGNTKLPRISADGTVGWVIVEPPVKSPNLSYELRPCREIVVCHRGKIVGKIRSVLAFIEEWKFVEGQVLHCAVMSRQSHGPAKIELIAAPSGKVISAVDAFVEEKSLPPWARGFGK